VSTGAALVVAVDCSTTAAKAVIHDEVGRVVAQAVRPLRTLQPRPAWHEQDAEQWWVATQGAVADAVASLADPGSVGALCLTHQRESFVCLDGAGQPLRPAILWLDGRAHEQIAQFGSSRVHALSGKPPDTTPAIYKLAWLARHEPAVLRDAVFVGDVQAYLAWRLTGRWATSHGSADTLGLFDLQRMDWSSELLDLAGVRLDQLPDLVPAGELLGTVAPEVARLLGLPGPVPLVAGIGDGQAAGLGLGATAPGVAYLNLGTSMVLGVQSEQYLWDPAFRTLAGIRPGTYTLETVLNAAAYVATWCREQFGEAGAQGARGAELEAAAARLPIGAEGLLTLPYWNAAQTPYSPSSCARGDHRVARSAHACSPLSLDPGGRRIRAAPAPGTARGGVRPEDRFDSRGGGSSTQHVVDPDPHGRHPAPCAGVRGPRGQRRRRRRPGPGVPGPGEPRALGGRVCGYAAGTRGVARPVDGGRL